MPLLFGFELRGLNGLIRSLGTAGDRLEQGLRQRMAVVVEKVAGRAVYHVRGKRATNPPTLLGRDTGRLAKHIKGFVEAEGAGSVKGIVGVQTLVYGRIHELGGTIVPRYKPLLAWQDDAGSWHFAKKVRIPPRPFLQPALDESRPVIIEELGNAWNGVVKAED